ncbi:MAG: ABC transporter permease [Gemmatimonadota bacterium]
MRPDEELPLSRKLPVDVDVRRELAYHIEERTRELIAIGRTPDAAAVEARAVFGDLDSIQAECRVITRRDRWARRRAETFESYRQDLVLAFRLLRKSPAFALAAILTLALGIGANAAIFSAVNGILLKPLPYDHPGQLVDISEANEHGWSNVPWANMMDWRAQSRSFDGMAAYGYGDVTVLTSQGPANTRVAVVSEDFFKVMRTTAAHGRLPLPEEHREGVAGVAVVSDAFWRSHLNATTDLTAQHLKTDRDYQVVGVLPPGFQFPRDVDVWMPLEPAGNATSRTAHNWATVARLKPHVSLVQADRELDTLTARMAELYKPDFDAVGANLTPLQDLLTTSARRPLYLLLGASALLLLAACTNLASSILARGMARQQEIAVRIAIGAGRIRIIRQLLTESMLLAVLGCVSGLVAAELLLKLFVHLAPGALRLSDVHVDGWVLVFTGLVGASTTVLIGLFPALRTSGAQPGLALREGGRAGTGRGERKIWGALVVAEVALAATLLCASGLTIRSLGAVLQIDPGFRPDSVLTVTLSLPTVVYDDDHKREQVWSRILDGVRAVPGVEIAALNNSLPLSGVDADGAFGIEGVAPNAAGYGPGNAGYRMISEQYFAAMAIPLLSGRDFAARDVDGAEATVMINQSLARRWFKDQDPVGHRIRLQSGMDNQGDNWLTIIGIVGDVHHNSLTRPPFPELYVPFRQRPTRGYAAMLVIKTRGEPTSLTPAVTAVLQQTVPEAVPVFRTMNDRLAGTQTDRRFVAIILSAFALIALLLAGVGIYGVVSYTAAQRTREMGIRMALGADPSSVRGLVLRGAMGQVVTGLGIGLVAALASTRILQSLLYQTSATDPVAFVATAALLLGVAWLASYLPAWRMARLDPALTIRSE